MKSYISFFLALFILSFSPAIISARAAAPVLPGLSVSGTEIVANSKPVRLRGVNMGDPFWARDPALYPNYSLADYNTLSQDWRANVVRISIFPAQWKNMDHATLLNGLAQEINAALDNGMYVIISYHVIGWPDGFYQQANPGNPADTYDSSMSVATSFWSAIAQTYGSDTRIIFDLWNEPVHPDDFTLYGSDPNPLWPILKGYYESLIQTVRSNGGQNIVIATGNRWASWLVGIKDNPLTDANVVYAYHKYSVNGLNTPTEWDKDTGGLIGVKPVIVSEWGYEDTDAGANPTWPGSEASYGDAFTQWMESHKLSNLAWMYHYDWTPALLKSNGSLTLYGTFVKNYISSSALVSLDPAKISFQEIATGLTQPVFITNAGDGSGRIFVVEQPGRVRIQKNGTLLSTPFLDIQSIAKTTGGEQGLLSLAFDPAYATNGNFYVIYTAPRNGDSTGSNLVLEKFSVSANNPDLANPNSGVILLTISHSVNSNHNGGTLAFGQDGYLYWSTGDGGSGGDPPNNAQQLNNLLGKIIRIDVHSGSPYGIPTSNPFYSSIDPNVKKEIWAYGLRNSWRFSFDRLTHDLYIGDVGQDTEEEVDFQAGSAAGGQNYGWRILEGNLCYNPSTNCVAPVGYIPPVATYDHGTNDSYGCAITGGYVYRGSNFPSLYGYYFYGDYCSGRLFSLYKDPTLGWKSVQLLDTAYSISTFGEDENGELYFSDYSTGTIYKLGYMETTFRDVPFNHPYWNEIEILYQNGFTAGCNTTPLEFCPDTIMNRAQTAVFMMRGNFGGGYIPPSPASHFFTDNWATATWAETWAEAMFTNNLTAGCSLSPLMFCPYDQLTNAQAAVFGLRLKYGVLYTPPAASGSVFADMTDVNFWATGWSEQAYADGLIPACGTSGGKPKFCPDALVTRGFGASVIVKAKNLTMP